MRSIFCFWAKGRVKVIEILLRVISRSGAAWVTPECQAEMNARNSPNSAIAAAMPSTVKAVRSL